MLEDDAYQMADDLFLLGMEYNKRLKAGADDNELADMSASADDIKNEIRDIVRSLE